MPNISTCLISTINNRPDFFLEYKERLSKLREEFIEEVIKGNAETQISLHLVKSSKGLAHIAFTFFQV